MILNADRPIYLQICDRICDDILAGKYVEDDRIPSVRECAVLFEVNTNTAVKAYDNMARENIIFNKRGLGYFVSSGAKSQILDSRKRKFLEEQMPDLFRQMRLLGIDIDDIRHAWDSDTQ